jgi:2-methylcitrate dehydratase PrpD
MTTPPAPAAKILADYALTLRSADLPPAVVRLARQCLIDAAACALHGSRQPWSQMILATVLAGAGDGPCGLADALPRGLPPGPAALCLGAFAHAFELDSLRKPGAGVHPGATVAMPALVVAQSVNASSEALIEAIVAGCEVMFRIGDATLHTPESVGFHAPGLTGPFGAATAAGRLMGLDADALANAYGICGSLSGGLLNFARSRQGGMVKRLHLGRAAEAGILAASLAARGFEGPDSILEGPFGLLDAFCDTSDPARLSAGLGTRFETENICFKRYACHVTAQAPVQLLQAQMQEHGFVGAEIVDLSLTVSDKVLSHHAERHPRDLMLAQYSVPFSVAVAAFRDPLDPQSFDQDSLDRPEITDLAGRIVLHGGRPKGWGAAMTIRLADGRVISAELESFEGCPESPMTEEGLAGKVWKLTGRPETDFDVSALLAARPPRTLRREDTGRR